MIIINYVLSPLSHILFSSLSRPQFNVVVFFLHKKVLIGFELGLITLWDMKAKCAEIRWQSHEPLRSISWHHEGKHFVSSHIDGSLCTWPLRATAKPQLLIYPHAKPTKDGKLETCKPIHNVDLKTTRNGFVAMHY